MNIKCQSPKFKILYIDEHYGLPLAKPCLKPTSLCESINFIACPSRAGTGRGGVEMLVAGCSMLVEDPVFSGDKEKNLPYSIQSS